MATGTVSVGSIVISDESLNLDQLIDVTATNPITGQTLIFKDNAVDVNYLTGWHSKALETNDFSDVNTLGAVQNDLLTYNYSAQDPTYGATDGWFPKNVASIFSELDSTVNSIVGLTTARIRSEEGDPARTDLVLYTAAEASASGPTCSIGSNGSNNVIEKKEPADGSFSFVQTLGKGAKLSLTVPAGTVLRSSKGIYGFSGPLPTPLGPASFALTKCQFYVSGAATLSVVSMGTEVTVSLFAGDQSTLLSGPTIITAYQTGSFSCPSVGEYFVNSTGPICASVNENNANIRPLMQMRTDLITMNTGCLVSAMVATTTVTWFRRSGTTGSITVSPGTAVALGAGNNSILGNNGWVRVTADKPISTVTTSDSIGSQSLSGFPANQLAQLFCNPSFIDATASYGEGGVAIGSQFEGTATVFTSAGVVLDTFTYTRSVAVTTAADQVYPAGGRWKPSDVDGTTTWDGGYIETSTPAVCIMNSSGDTTWSSTGQEIFIVGSTPEEIKADIKKDGNGIWRRRDVSNTGVVTWNIC